MKASGITKTNKINDQKKKNVISEIRTPNPDVPKSLEFDVFPLALHYKASYNSNIYLKEITAKNDCLLLQTALSG